MTMEVPLNMEHHGGGAGQHRACRLGPTPAPADGRLARRPTGPRSGIFLWFADLVDYIWSEAHGAHMVIAKVLLEAERWILAGRFDDAASLLGNAMMSARGPAKRPIAAWLKSLCDRTSLAVCNYGFALMCGDGVKADPPRGAAMLQNVADNDNPKVAEFAHNFLGHYHRGAFGAPPDMQRALMHFERVGALGNAEAAFNAGMFFDKEQAGVERDVPRAIANYRNGVKHGSAKSMTNLALMIIVGEVPGERPEDAIRLLEHAGKLGDTHAEVVLGLIQASASEMDAWSDFMGYPPHPPPRASSERVKRRATRSAARRWAG